MKPSGTAREALIVEALGDIGELLERVDAVASALDKSCQAQHFATSALQEELTRFERNLGASSDRAKEMAVKHIGTFAIEVTRRSIETQRRTMADSARKAFADELAPTLQCLQASLHPFNERRGFPWESWLSHAAASVAAAAAVWMWVQGKAC